MLETPSINNLEPVSCKRNTRIWLDTTKIGPGALWDGRIHRWIDSKSEVLMLVCTKIYWQASSWGSCWTTRQASPEGNILGIAYHKQKYDEAYSSQCLEWWIPPNTKEKGKDWSRHVARDLRKEFPNGDGILQQDLAPCHTARNSIKASEKKILKSPCGQETLLI